MIDRALELKRIENQPLETLKKRISRGYRWLKENIDHPSYKDHLWLYERLVERIRKFGVNEEDCWEVEDIPEEEIKEIFMPKPPKNLELIDIDE